ncbi:MAG: anti-sigma F factor [Clostridia bacterium]
MKKINEMELKFKAISVNEGFARACVAAFCVQANPSLDEITDIKTAVSEAVTNAVVHAYPNHEGDVIVKVQLFENGVQVEVIDKGIGIENIGKAREPFYTSKPADERSGMGFTVMESFMDSVEVESKEGVCIKMFKRFGKNNMMAVGE